MLGDDFLEPDPLLQIITLIVLLLLSTFFSSAETALTTVNKHRLRALSEEGNKRAIRVLALINNPSRFLSTVLIGNNIVNLSASALTATLTASLFGNKFVGIATGILTLVVLVFCEITPKTFATLYSESISLIYVDIINGLTFLLTPIVWSLNCLSKGLFFLLRIQPNKTKNSMTESELRTIVDVSHEHGVIESEEKSMINNVVDFGDSLAKNIMIPRADMTFAPADSSFEELLSIFIEEQYSRIPIYEESKDNVIGILYLKDLFFYIETHKFEPFHLKDILREPFFIYEYQKTPAIMADMRSHYVSLAIVLDEYGTTVGMITMEDLIEEIIGDIKDEYDVDELETVRMIHDNLYEADGATKLTDLNDIIGTDLTSEDYDSIGGYIIELLDHLPIVGEMAEKDGIVYKVIALDKNRIDRVSIRIST